MSNLNLQKLCEWVWPWPSIFKVWWCWLCHYTAAAGDWKHKLCL